VADPGEPLAHDSRFFRQDLIAGLPAAVVPGNVAVPVRRGHEDIDRARMRRMPFAAPVAFQHLGALVRRHHPLDLQQQRVFRGLPQLPVQEHHLDAGPLTLIDHQHLIGILARQPIRRGHREAVHSPDGHRIAQSLQRRTHQRRTTVPLINARQRVGQVKPIPHDAFLQGGHLALDGVRLGLSFRRDACLHSCRRSRHHACAPPTRCVSRSRPARLWCGTVGAARRVIGATRS
jgi:hypothetical protein